MSVSGPIPKQNRNMFSQLTQSSLGSGENEIRLQEEINLQYNRARLLKTIPKKKKKNFLKVEQQLWGWTIHSRCFSQPLSLHIISSISRACCAFLFLLHFFQACLLCKVLRRTFTAILLSCHVAYPLSGLIFHISKPSAQIPYRKLHFSTWKL